MCTRKCANGLLGFYLATWLLTIGLSGEASGQSAFQKMKLQFFEQACKGGDQNSCRQLALLKQKLSQQNPQAQAPGQGGQSQKGPKPQQAAPQSSQAAYQPVSGSDQSANGQPDSSCCTADAMKKMAATAGFVDVVGIKLGMTPQQAVAAIKAHNPALTVKPVNIRIEHPGAIGMVRVPHYIVGYNASRPAGYEVIVVEFTTPPNPPLAEAVSRFTNFQPTLVANLLKGLEDKYGQQYPPVIHGGVGPLWLFDQNGKQITTQSTTANQCTAAVPLVAGGGFTANAEEDRDASPGINVESFRGFPFGTFGDSTNHSICTPFTLVWTSDFGTELGPNYQTTNIVVSISSGALAYASQRSTHDWLQAEADAQVKAAHDAAAKSKGTTF